MNQFSGNCNIHVITFRFRQIGQSTFDSGIIREVTELHMSGVDNDFKLSRSFRAAHMVSLIHQLHLHPDPTVDGCEILHQLGAIMEQ